MAALIPPDQIALNIRKLLDDNIKAYRDFGVYWYFVKAFLKKYYDINQMPYLGDFVQEDVVAHMPEYDNFSDAMHDALLTCRVNMENNMGSATSIAPDDEPVTLFDEDIGI